PAGWTPKAPVAPAAVVPYFRYAKFVSLVTSGGPTRLRRPLATLPLFEYSLRLARRDFALFRHVAFDQLVTPQTCYIPEREIREWLRTHPAVDPGSTYVIFRNGNSWKFGGRARVE